MVFFYSSELEIKKIYAQPTFEGRRGCIAKLSDLHFLYVHGEITRDKIDEFCKLTEEEERRARNFNIKDAIEDIVSSVKSENERLAKRHINSYRHNIAIIPT